MKNKTKTKRKGEWQIAVLDWMGFLIGFQLSLSLYILPAFFRETGYSDQIEIYFLIAYAGAFLVLLNLHHLVARYGRTRTFLIFLVLRITTLVLAGSFVDWPGSLVLMTISIFADAVMFVCLDYLIERFSTDKTTGKTRGLHLSLLNAGFLIGPFLAVWLIEHFGYAGVFFFSGAVVFLVALSVRLFFFQIDGRVRKPPSLKNFCLKLVRRKNILRVFWIAFLLDFFYAVTVVYVPLYVLENGADWEAFGTVLTIMLIPFVIVQYPLGLLADRIGEKEILFSALVLMGVFIGAVSFLEHPTVVALGMLLFLGRVGAAALEVGRDAYFYKKIGPADVDLMDFFRTSRSLAYLLAMPLFGVLGYFWETSHLFFILGLVMIVGIIPAWKLKDTD